MLVFRAIAGCGRRYHTEQDVKRGWKNIRSEDFNVIEVWLGTLLTQH